MSLGIVLAPVLAFAIVMCPKAMYVAGASVRVQPAVQAPSPLPDSSGRSVSAFRERLASSGDWTPCTLTSGDKFRLFLKRSASPSTYVVAGLSAGLSQWRNDKYGPGFTGFAQRYGANVADGAAHSIFQTYVYSSVLRQDPRYHRLGEGTIARRSLYVASRLFVLRTERGRNVVNAPEWLGTLTASAIGNFYYPESDRGFGRTMYRAATMMGSRAGIFALHEFVPDIKRKLRRHTQGMAPATIVRQY